MGKIVLHPNTTPEQIDRARAERYNSLPFAEKLTELFSLIDLAVKMNGGKPLKQPQGKGIVIRKPVI
jgi:hypothetical protein